MLACLFMPDVMVSIAPSVAELTRALAGRQLAYVQGVSNWNFDVAELKARAALEDPLPTVPERAHSPLCSCPSALMMRCRRLFPHDLPL